MVGGGGLAVIADNLEAANHLTNSKETKALGGNNTTGDKRREVQVLDS